MGILYLDQNMSQEEVFDIVSKTENLTELFCFCNENITSLPLFLPDLKILNCSGTNISVLPKMPKLQVLWCENIPCTVFPKMDKLFELLCYGVPFTRVHEMQRLDSFYSDIMNIYDYKSFMTNCKALLMLSSIQTLKLDSNLKGLKDINVSGFNIVLLIKNML